MAEPRDLPLFRWGAELRRARRERARRLRLLACGLAGALALGASTIAPTVPRLVWNVSTSAPRGLYLVLPAPALQRGDMVAAWTPATVRDLAARRHYLPANVPLVKRVAAIPGDHVCALDRWIIVNGTRRAERSPRDPSGRPMPWWRACRMLDADEYLLLMPAQASFDGRYFGPVRTRDILGKAVPLWTR
jgi:conjugative transfer signal peptidase TraF